MNKRKLFRAFLNYLNFRENSANVFENKISKEELFIQNIVNENIKINQKQPPADFFIKLKNKKNQMLASKDLSKQKTKVWNDILINTYVTGFFKFQTRFIFASMFIIVLVITLSVPLKTEKSKIEKLSLSRQFTLIKEGDVLKEVGLSITAQLIGKLAFESKNQREHVYIKTGYWFVDSDYASFKKETWFHFPGGGIKSMGAKFYIDVTSGSAKITLNQGRIQAYSTDENGVVIKTTIENAPYFHEYNNKNLVPFYESDLLADKSNSMVVQKIDPFESKEQMLLYCNFIGAYVSILQNDGSRLSGILKKVWNEKLHIQTGTGLVEVTGKNLTLVGLNTTTK
ncbi:MAG: hypothetical protein OEV78_02055 [Spirochaetia bacterium]|nr:hypothetical protein [Spirochaetia bacterium]